MSLTQIEAVRQAAWTAYQAGLCVVPPREDGSKVPLGKWKPYQQERPSNQQVEAWYTNGRYGVGLITGAVSENLEVLDFDLRAEVYPLFKEVAAHVGLGALVERIEAGYSERSPGGIHLPYHCSEISGNLKLARRPKRPEERTHDKDHWQVLIETRGEGGFIITAPSFGPIHPSSQPYVMLSGSFATIATITPEERKALHDLARSFSQEPPREQHNPSAASEERHGRPGDDLNGRATWDDVLTPHGWTPVYTQGDVTFWRRPGKDAGVSATTGYAGLNIFYPFTSSSDFEPNTSYSPFGVYAVLEHNGDYQAAARELAAQGYGQATRGHRPRRIRSFTVEVAV